ncbi:pyruvate dehydrogenase complex dihydrolipoamide acetyltransferase [Flavobacterium sp. CBA20B-1]|uniref:pyruvate dehydrogenase complex dihydrolipoamide acetyltransferase n=1 Tax=unclassified Flavobacterium TaxID=196869 RepID=UPI0022246DA7|nr:MULTISPECIES: pyruvate dehydrogenase complex dihydrolipoamide acetyltransferase [unclassified Flavobacterium]WCM43362.1 pyruvate dehydrogenase complex dihydrolipoamide acetyltransferase [Flavobacterium sp. CBA20B-1]
MAEIITMPRLSDTMTEGTVASWLKKVGDKISEGDILAEIETDKATMEFESFHQGTLLYIGVQEGETAAVDSVLAIIGKEGEDYKSLLEGSTSEGKKNEPSDTKEEKSGESDSKADTSDKEEVKEEETASEVPDNVSVVTMPRLSDTMTEGTVASWLKKVGDEVKEGDILAEIETDKATMEFESFYAGTLLHIGIQEGESAPVDSVLAIIGPAGTDVSGILSGGSKPKAKSESKKEESSEDKSGSKKESNSAEIKEESAKTETSSATNDSNRIFASPLAKKIAQDKGINLSEVKGSGENGRIVKSDVENFTPSAKTASTETKSEEKVSSTSAPKAVPTGEVFAEEVKNSQMRKTIARRLAESKFTAPHYYLTIEVNMDNAMESRTLINSLPDTKVSFNDMVVKACAMALKKHPKVNSQWTEAATIVNHHVNIGVAVAVEDGLVVPVVNHTDLLSLTQIGSSIKDLAGKARSKKLQPKEMEGSTFTVSNLGMFGIEEFTSIINQPNSAILSVGAIIEKPVVKNGQIVVGNTMKVTLACDHRTVDGATGAEFLQTLKHFIENPVTMLA